MRVVIIDSHRGKYLTDPDIERELLPRCSVEIIRVEEPLELIGRIDDAGGIISCHTIALPAKVLSCLSRCRGIVRAAVGFDNIDIEFASSRGIPVSNVPDYGTEEVADHTIALVLALRRNLMTAARHVKAGGWDWQCVGSMRRNRGATYGIVGLGRIGTAVATRAIALGFNVQFFDPYRPAGTEKALAIGRVENLVDLMATSHVVSIHVPLCEQTANLIGQRELAAMRDDAILINTARGGVVDTDALVARLSRSAGFACGLDVVAGEPKIPQALRENDQVLLTAHSAFFSIEAVAELRRKAATTMSRLLSGKSVATVVNHV